MRQTWRWFGPVDKVTTGDALQAGAEGLVCSLYHVAPGLVWTREAIAQRQAEARLRPDGKPSGLEWEVVESLPVSEAIKTQTDDWREHIAAWKQSLENLKACGLEVICYNFMPVLDWTRTKLAAPLDNGGTAMVFDLVDFAIFDISILKREGAERDFSAATVEAAKARAAAMSELDKKRLSENVIAGLPGAFDSWSLEALAAQLQHYRDIDADKLRRHLIDFLSEVAPVAERLGLRLCCHPDDPPFPLMGLPRVMSTEADYAAILQAVDSPANGMTYCTGSLGARADNDLVGIVERLGSRIHFAHLRNVTRYDDTVPNGFFEDTHLGGQADMVGVVGALLAEEGKRRTAGRGDAVIPMRPDHGHDLLDDLKRGAQPGYPAIGRLKGLAELRGVISALQAIARRNGTNPCV
ncbi:mannonate dehydratase [Labrys neptuniae]